MSNLLLPLILALLLLMGCAKQEFERKVTSDGDGNVILSVCRVEASSFWRVTAAEAIQGQISCSDDRDTVFGVVGHEAKGDAALATALGGLLGRIAEGAAKGASPVP